MTRRSPWPALAVAVLLAWQAYRGRWFLLPLLGDVALELATRGRTS